MTEPRSWQTVTNLCYIIIDRVNKARWEYFKTNILPYDSMFEEGAA
jgi:hypothetical protein